MSSPPRRGSRDLNGYLHSRVHNTLFTGAKKGKEPSGHRGRADKQQVPGPCDGYSPGERKETPTAATSRMGLEDRMLSANPTHRGPRDHQARDRAWTVGTGGRLLFLSLPSDENVLEEGWGQLRKAVNTLNATEAGL